MITSPTNKIYIGSTTNITRRWRRYKYLTCKSQPKLYNSLKKHDYSKHTIEVIWSGDPKEMLKYEHLIGIYYEVLNKGLNCKLPKYGDTYCAMSNASRLKLKLINTGKINSPETRQKISLGNKNKTVTEDFRKRMSIIGKEQHKTIAQLDKFRYASRKKVVCTVTNKSFDSITEAAAYLNISMQSLARKLRGVEKNTTTLTISQ